ncbi:uncharacterized protein PITG_22076 [Phytophthora infestans T30-4]|uniref:PX domain-containing protein n=1 Tax=Phytophthora infestans (strain T30-4) TaxID=403677 RepID=D0P4W3_PHYIT|nr:uncharacterized protein PITG_22076 [Phytophthora infestans T30-4]EEY53072.1 conserved hypothetical protein [Phytophthora infestans T30-4]|eukprot:XP_002894736.1 conserved hypothetical protein [Phytophthora infestans T30-4]
MSLLQQSSDDVVGGLARLTPMNPLPERYSRHMQTVTKLKQIRCVLVSAANGSYVIDKTFSDFVELRDDLYETCTSSCSFCSEVSRTLLLGASLPGSVLSLVLSQRQRTKAVQRFIENLLQLATSCPIVDYYTCPCQEQLPRELFLFLFGESGPLG